MALQFEFAGSQIDGARDYQEDAFLITHLSDKAGDASALVVVADGMGGHAAGNVASNMAVQAFNKHVSANYPARKVSEILHESVMQANSSITATISETPALQGMGCTLVAAVLEKAGLWWASVGDSHLYLIRSRKLEKKNADHSYGGFLDRMKAEGKEVEKQAGLSRNMLMSAVTGDEIVEIDCPSSPLPIKPGDRIMICSDGMDTLSKGKLIQYSQWAKTPKDCAEALLKGVEEAKKPRQDNTTIVVVDVLETDAKPKPAPERTTLKAARGGRTPAERSRQAARAAPGSKAVTAIAAIFVLGLAAFFILPRLNLLPQQTPDISPSSLEEPGSTDWDAETTAAPGAEADAPEETAAAEEEAPPAEAPPIELRSFRDPLQTGPPGPLMVALPGGAFKMGDSGFYGDANEKPLREIQVRPFAIGKFEVTVAEYQRFAKITGRKVPGGTAGQNQNLPVSGITWEDAYLYAKWLTDQTGKRYRLPSEAEWEYAASGGNDNQYWWGTNMEAGRVHCQFGCRSRFDIRMPIRVGGLPANGFGLHETVGNVSEWIEDCWHPNYVEAPTNSRVWLGGDCSYRVIRGGSYESPEKAVRTAARDRAPATTRQQTIGFRIARDLEDE
ncbi:MAG: SUMF1/EgtB/PvdO family nonheme iron enzyme [Gammaproteobacteria bacterium]|nr:SUMF1/EgtB/PvdO family nonheme iron enzyme [Gammaproteobacteria bacterium]